MVGTEEGQTGERDCLVVSFQSYHSANFSRRSSPPPPSSPPPLLPLPVPVVFRRVSFVFVSVKVTVRLLLGRAVVTTRDDSRLLVKVEVLNLCVPTTPVPDAGACARRHPRHRSICSRRTCACACSAGLRKLNANTPCDKLNQQPYRSAASCREPACWGHAFIFGSCLLRGAALYTDLHMHAHTYLLSLSLSRSSRRERPLLRHSDLE